MKRRRKTECSSFLSQRATSQIYCAADQPFRGAMLCWVRQLAQMEAVVFRILKAGSCAVQSPTFRYTRRSAPRNACYGPERKNRCSLIPIILRSKAPSRWLRSSAPECLQQTPPELIPSSETQTLNGERIGASTMQSAELGSRVVLVRGYVLWKRSMAARQKTWARRQCRYQAR